MNPTLEIKDLVVGYPAGLNRHTTVLGGVSGQVYPGQLVALVGPNGAGKSTLLRSMAGLQPTYGGSVSICGDDITTLKGLELARRLAVVLTDRFDSGRLTVREVVALGRHPHSPITGRLSATDQRVISESLRTVGAADLAHKLLNELSDGQRQRVLVARALAQEPKVLLLDEPTAFLDPPARVSLIGLVRLLCVQRNIAAVLCTHDIEGVLRDADLVWVAGSDGRLTAGAPEDLVLDGTLANRFATPGVVFDPASLTFQPELLDAPQAVVLGQDVPALMAARAMMRAGFRPVGTARDASLPQVIVGPGSWTLRVGGADDVVCPDLASLHQVATRLRTELAGKA